MNNFKYWCIFLYNIELLSHLSNFSVEAMLFVGDIGGINLWEEIEKNFSKFPAQGKVARLMLRMGLKVEGSKIFCGEVELSDTAIGRAVGVDRRVVRDTTKTINKKKKLKYIFSKLYPTCCLKDVAGTMGWNVIEIIPEEAEAPGIISAVSAMFSERNISIRQMIIEEDPVHAHRPRGYIITERPIPAEMIPKIKDVAGVHGVTLL